MMEHLSPGKGGGHRQTLSYGKSPDLTSLNIEIIDDYYLEAKLRQ